MSDPNDREFEDFLAGRDKVSKAYREATRSTQAPEELDAAILAAARQAASRPKAARRPRWIRPMALAATLILSLSVLVNIWRDPVSRELASPTMDAAVLPPAPKKMITEPSDLAQASRSSGRLHSAQPESMAKGEEEKIDSFAASQEAREAQAQAIQEAKSSPNRDVEPNPDQRSAPHKSASTPSTREKASARMAPEPEAQAVPSAPIAGATPTMPEALRKERPERQARLMREHEEAVSKPEQAEPPSQTEQSQKLPQITVPAQNKDQRTGAERMSQLHERADGFAGARASAAEAESSIAPAAPDDAGERRARFQSEVEKVRELIKADEREAAQRVLSSLREAYPDQSLPQDLQLFLDQQ